MQRILCVTEGTKKLCSRSQRGTASIGRIRTIGGFAVMSREKCPARMYRALGHAA